MAQKKSSIEFTEAAKAILKSLTIRDSQKNIVSAGVIVFSKLSETQRSKAIGEANGVEGAKLELADETVNVKKLWTEVEKIAKKLGIKIEIPK